MRLLKAVYHFFNPLKFTFMEWAILTWLIILGLIQATRS